MYILLYNRPSKDGYVITPNAGSAPILSAPASISESGFSQFNSFLRRSSAAFIGDVSRVRQGNLIGSSISEEPLDLTSANDEHNVSNTEMTRASIQPGVNIFQKEGLKCRGNLLNTVNGSFTAATRGGLLSPPTYK